MGAHRPRRPDRTVPEARTGETLQPVTDGTGDVGRIHGETSDVTELRARAREAAYAKPLQYAWLRGRRLGRLVPLTEGAAGGPSPVPALADVADGGAGVPISPGRIQDGVRGTVVYELD